MVCIAAAVGIWVPLKLIEGSDLPAGIEAGAM